jgi:DNA-binding transcriptional regulator YhcF (GntR family)
MSNHTDRTSNAAARHDSRGERRLDSRTLWEQVRDRLREDVLSGELPPGTVLSESSLARSFGVSRGPIREALGRLERDGLVTITPRRGAIVTELSREEFVDAYQVREALETLAIQHAVSRLSGADIARLRELFRTLEEKSRLIELLNECVGRGDSPAAVSVRIGRELAAPAMQACALITAPYRMGVGDGFGALGVFGPMRIEYARTMAVVNYVAQRIGRVLGEGGPLA